MLADEVKAVRIDKPELVLILVLLEYARRHNMNSGRIPYNSVLILVLLEYARRLQPVL